MHAVRVVRLLKLAACMRRMTFSLSLVALLAVSCGLDDPDGRLVAGDPPVGATTSCPAPTDPPTTTALPPTLPPPTLPPPTLPPTTLAPTTLPPPTLPPTTLAPTTLPPPTLPPTTLPARALELGERGTEVADAQQRLTDLGFWLPEISGEYDEATLHAVTAFEKLNGLDRDGLLSIEDQGVLEASERTEARSSAGHVIEVDIAHQVVLIVDDGTVTWILDTSTGARPGSTPIGSFTVHREIDGMRVSALGRLYRPKYVIGGVALHGYPDVPAQPASHGCIRLTYQAMDAVWGLDLAPLGTQVLVYDD